MTHLYRFTFLCMLWATMITGCSISGSLGSLSDSISSPFQSISGSLSSSSGDRQAAYESDVRDYTLAYVRSGGDFDEFMAGLGGIASKHGITNWEEDSATYIGIGRGLKAAGVSTVQLEVYKTNLSKGDVEKAAAMQKGYDSGK